MSGREILIVEDSPTQAEQLRYLLSEAGHEVVAAADGEQALALAIERRPRIVITDVVMPRMDGYTLCERVKAHSELRDTPVILLTSLASPHDVLRGLACGADNFIRKPYDADYLLARVSHVLTNLELRKADTTRMGLEVVFGGQRHFITAERQQIFDFLFSTFEEAVQLTGELTRSYRSIEGLYRIAESLNRCTTAEAVTTEALERALELPGIEAAWLLVLEGEDGLRLAGSRGALDGAALDADSSCRRLLLSDGLRTAANVERCECVGRSHASVPLRAGDRVVGMLSLAGPGGGGLGEDDLRTLDAVGNQVGEALERAQLQEHLERRVADRTAELRTAAAIVQSSDDGIIRLSTDGTIETWNPGAERLYGHRAADAVGRSLELLVPPDRVDEVAGLLARVAQGESLQGHETVRRTRTGEERDVSLTLSPVRGDAGAVVGVAEIARDITARRQLEKQLLASQKLESVGRLAGGIAHDFNNLMTVVIGFSDLLLAARGDEKTRRGYVKEIKRSGERATALSQQLLAFGRRQLLRPVVLDLNAVVADMEALVRRLIGEDIDLLVMPGPDLSSVKVDRSNLEQVVMNLVINARDAMPDGGHITIETANVLVEDDTHPEKSPGAYVMLTVSDSGVGMDPQTQESIFEPFFTTKDPGKGTGLGLSVVFGIVKQSGGSISVYSEPGHGATFRIYLPATLEAAVQAEPVAPAEILRGTETILVVEDEEGVRVLIGQLLREHGYTVIATGSPEEALTLSEHHDGPIDLLVTDMVMPRLSGREIADRLRPERPDMAVLYVSGYTGDAMIHRGLLEPDARFLTKPFKARELLGVVREILDETTGPRAAGERVVPPLEGPPTRVVLADDEASVRGVIATVLGAEPDFEVVAEAATTSEAIAAVEEHDPDLLLLDVDMPGGGGTVVSRAVAERRPATVVVALTGAAESETVREMLAAGSAGYLLKGTPTAELLASVRDARTRGPREVRPGAAPAPATNGDGIRVLVVDDQVAVLDVLSDVIDRQPDLALVGVAQSPFHAVTLAARHQPDVAVLDAHMRSGGGARVAAEIRGVSPETQIVVLTGNSDRRTVMGMLRSGATSVISGGSHRRLVDAIVASAEGGSTMSGDVMTVLLDELVNGAQGPAEALKLEQERRKRITAVLADEDMLAMHVQPVHDLDRREAVGFEALARFRTGAQRTPDVWFAEAARLGLHVDLELLAVRRALELLPLLPADAWLSVNAGPDTLMTDDLARLLLASEPERIIVELTEHAAVADYDALTARVDVLRHAGVRLAVDDCGAGFASLKHVSLLRPDFIKLDVSLCRDLRDVVRSALVRALLAFGQEIDIAITAEGIESSDDLDALRRLGVRLGQGYFLGRPGPIG
ncbi:MAG TPA: response regulator [Solirubrobacteraceae bacterium]|nr:response regulator [Solirubrobacteraceae bacterium]